MVDARHAPRNVVLPATRTTESPINNVLCHVGQHGPRVRCRGYNVDTEGKDGGRPPHSGVRWSDMVRCFEEIRGKLSESGAAVESEDAMMQ